MFWPLFCKAVTPALILSGLIGLSAGAASAQTIGYGQSSAVSLHAVKVFRASPANSDNGQAMATLAALSAEAGIPFIAKPAVQTSVTGPTEVDVREPPLCVRAGVSLNPAVMAGPQMTVEHGLIGCPTNTGGLPIIVVQDPTLDAPPTSRSGQYNLDVTMRYRLMELQRLQLIASVTEQGVGYSLDSPVGGNNILAALTLMF
jgi:hypothetical protein